MIFWEKCLAWQMVATLLICFELILPRHAKIQRWCGWLGFLLVALEAGVLWKYNAVPALALTSLEVWGAGLICGVLGLVLSLPPQGTHARKWGLAFCVASLSLFCLHVEGRLIPVRDSFSLVFWIMALVTLLGGVGTITSRLPVYCALWFGLTLLGTSGLFLIVSAQFLAVATVVVYAGAILVTFLFVLMLASPRGNAPSDRMSWEPWLSSLAGVGLIAILTTVLSHVQEPANANQAALRTVTHGERTREILAEAHVAHLGRELFTTHLVSVEVAGALLMIGLAGAVAIVAHGKDQE